MEIKRIFQELSFSAYKRAIRLLWDASTGMFILQVILYLIQSVLPLGILYATKNLFDMLIEEGTTYQNVLFWMLILLGIQLLTTVISQFNSYITELFQQKLTDKTASIIIEKSIVIPFAYFEDHRYHDSLHLAQSQAMYRLPFLHQVILNTFSNLLGLSLLLGYFFSLISVYAWIILLIAIPLASIKWYSGYMLYKLERKTIPAERESSYYHTILTQESFAQEIRTLNFGEALLKRFNDIRRLIYQEKKNLQSRLLGYSILAEIAEVTVLFIILIGIAKQAFFGILQISLLVVYIQGVQRMQSNLKNFLNSLVQLIQQRIFLNDLFRFLDIQNPMENPKNKDLFPKDDCSITVNNLSFAYPNINKVVLSNLNMSFPQGKVIGIVGANGSGKSTFVKLLAGLYSPENGSIYIGDKLLESISHNSFRENSLILFQDFQNYYFSIEDIISLGKKAKEDHDTKLKEAINKSQSAEFIDSLEEGIHTKMGRIFEGGKNLSGGQWQKLAIARAFYRDPRVIILDEPTSAMDAITETQVFRNFKNEAKDKVIILITHRLYNLKDADNIYVLEEGKIVQEGNFEELIKKEGIFLELYQNQSFQKRIGNE
ncbi:ABC transporter ATP-binding protein [Shivajiella indica]|uniref:ABC transporter ATP-binding protein n=1 Tax=Shivajiella indica TaxID=872115 RepID=A0ABW5B508_9BACT